MWEQGLPFTLLLAFGTPFLLLSYLGQSWICSVVSHILLIAMGGLSFLSRKGEEVNRGGQTKGERK